MPKYVVRSLSEACTTYLADTEQQTCTCKAFEHSGRKQWCKHLTFVTNRPDMYTAVEGVVTGRTSTLTPGKKSAKPKTQTLTPGDQVAGPFVQDDGGLYTIGTSNHSIETFLSLLEQHRLRVVIDVRSSPYSNRYPHFSREAIRRYVRETGIDYFWVGKELGGRHPVAISSVAFKGRMRQIQEMAERSRVVLMCSEGRPQDCHRAYKLMAWCHRGTGVNRAFHILRNGSVVDSVELEEQQTRSWLSTELGGKAK